MENILWVNACARKESRTKQLTSVLLSHLAGTVTEVDLYAENPVPLTQERMEIRDNAGKNGDFSHEMFRFAKQFFEADTVVISAPYWDLSCPAILKTYIEAIAVSGLTFRYGDNGKPKGLGRVKRLYYVATSGGFIGERNFGFLYTKEIFRSFYSVNEAHCFTAEGLDIVGADVPAILRDAAEKIHAAF